MLVNAFPARRTRDILSVIAVLAAAGIVVLFRLVRPEKLARCVNAVLAGALRMRQSLDLELRRNDQFDWKLILLPKAQDILLQRWEETVMCPKSGFRTEQVLTHIRLGGKGHIRHLLQASVCLGGLAFGATLRTLRRRTDIISTGHSAARVAARGGLW